MRKSGKEISFLTYHPVKKFSDDMQGNELYQLICKADFNFRGLPKSASLKKILQTKYDLLINGCITENEVLQTVAVFSHAKFRIGPFIQEMDDSYFYELMVKPNGADPLENYLIEIGKSLIKIK